MNREVLNSKKEMILEFVNSKSYKPMSTKEMGVVLQVPAKERKISGQFLTNCIARERYSLILRER